MLDRNKNSPTYGCFDRNYWHYKIIDFPCARFQEAALFLTLVYKIDIPNSNYRSNSKIKKYAVSALNFWSNIQHGDGSFDEWYPNEHSYVATAFPLYALSESFKILSGELSSYDRDHILDALIKAGQWLKKQKDPLVSNHEMGAATALYNLYTITKITEFKEASKSLVTRIIKNQSDEGWFPEYGGPDIGYLTLGIDYLAKYYKQSGDQVILDSLKYATEFLSYFIHPNGTLGGEYGSRNTEFFIPHGLEILSQNFPLAEAITDKYMKKLKAGTAFHPNVLDDRFIAYNLYTFLQAYEERKQRRSKPIKQKLPHEKEPFKKFFEESKLFVTKTNKYYAILGLNKGGIIKVYKYPDSNLVFSDCGIHGEISPSIYFSNQVLNKKYQIKIDNDSINVSGKFQEIRYHYLTLLSGMLFRTSLIIGGISSGFNNLIKQKLRERLILNYKPVPLNFIRTFKFNEDSIIVEDCIEMKEYVDVKNLVFDEKFELAYIPSSRYHSPQDLEMPSTTLNQNEVLKRLYSDGKIGLRRRIYPDIAKIEIELVD